MAEAEHTHKHIQGEQVKYTSNRPHSSDMALAWARVRLICRLASCKHISA